MKKLLILMLFTLVSAMGWAGCPGCGEWVDEDLWCSDCGYCIECAIENQTHCYECGECLESEGCEECGPSEGHCQSCAVYYQCLWCGGCFYVTGDLCCDECLACESCQSEAGLHCFECGDCLAGSATLCEVCGDCYDGSNHCQECSQTYQCIWCGKCFFLEGEDCCDECLACESCQGEAGLHCSNCSDCLAQGTACEICSADIGASNHCQSCGNEYQCIWCGNCYYEDGETCCSECLACESCQSEAGLHCVGCGDCLAQGIACDACGAEIGETNHCQSCAEEFLCDFCTTCGYEDQEIYLLGEYKLCLECAEKYIEFMCDYCGENERVCDDCELCQDCIDDMGIHCVVCEACLANVEICESCTMCPDCAADNHAHCKECEECFGADGVCEYCDLCEDCSVSEEAHCPICQECFDVVEQCTDCGYCLDCAVSEGIHCPICEECKPDMQCEDGGEHCVDCCDIEGWLCENCGCCTEALDIDKCDECGLCDDCAESEGVHCSICEQCKPDDRCVSGGDHCSDCCENEGWLCSQCERCTEAEGLSVCDDCGLCIECCTKNIKAKNCNHTICIKNSEWASHYCSTCDACLETCKHGVSFVEHTCNFVNGYCTICKASKSGVPVIYRQPQIAKCKVVDKNELIVSDNIAKYDTVKFTVGAVGDELAYQWYSMVGTAQATKVAADTDDKLYISGSQSDYLAITGPTSCATTTYYFCAVSNDKGTVYSDTVAVQVSHNTKWRDRSYLNSKADTLKKKAVINVGGGVTEERIYSDFHYKVCCGEGCNTYLGLKSAHDYGDWQIEKEATKDNPGIRYKACITCGEKIWQNTRYVEDYGQPIILQQPVAAKGQTPLWDDIEGNNPNVRYDTVSFQVEVKGDGLTYQWHQIMKNYDGKGYSWHEMGNSDSGEELVDEDLYLYVKGATDKHLTITVSPYACAYDIAYYCVISNDKGSVVSDTVSVIGTHNYVWRGIEIFNGYTAYKDFYEATYQDDYPSSGFYTGYSNFHYKLCGGSEDTFHEIDDLGDIPQKQSHTYGKWEASQNHPGYSYKACTVCGEKYWKKTNATGAPCIVEISGDSKTCKVPDFDSLEAITETYIPAESKFDTVSFYVDAIGENLKYQWYQVRYYPQEGTFGTPGKLTYVDDDFCIYGATSRKLVMTVPATACVDKTCVYCVVTNDKGETQSEKMLIRASHNKKWKGIEAVDEYNVYKTYVERVTIHKRFEGDTKGEEKTFSKYHYMVCACEEHHAFTKRVEEHKYDPWIVDVVPTATEYGSRHQTCSVCHEERWENLNPVADADNPYLALSGSYMIVKKHIESNSLGLCREHLVEVEILSGEVQNRDWVDVHLSGEQTIRMWVAGSGPNDTNFDRDGVTPYKKGSTVILALDDNDFAQGIPAGTVISNTSGLFGNSYRVQGTYSGKTMGKNSPLSFDMLNGSSVAGSFVSIQNESSHNGTNNFTGEALFEKSVVTYVGQKIPVYKDGTKLGVFTVGTTAVPAPDFYIVNSKNDTVRLAESDQTLYDGQVEYSYQEAKLTLKGAKLRTIHFGDETINDKSLTIVVTEGENSVTTSKKGENAIEAAGKLSMLAEKGATLNVTSKNASAIKAKEFEIWNNESIWALNCMGYDYALNVTDQFSSDGSVELYAKATRPITGVALRPCWTISDFGGAISEDDAYLGAYWEFNESIDDYEKKYTIVVDDTESPRFDDDTDPLSEFHLYPDPYISIQGTDYPIVNSGLKNFALALEKVNASAQCTGIISYDFKTHTLYIEEDPVIISDKSALYIGNSYIDTIYVKSGSNTFVSIESKSKSKGDAAISIGTGVNLKFIGEGEYQFVSNGNGIRMDDVAGSVTISDNVKMTIISDEYGVADSDDGHADSKLVIGKDATFYSESGVGDLKEVIIENNGEKFVEADGTVAFSDNQVRPTRILYPYAYLYDYDSAISQAMQFEIAESDESDSSEDRLVVGKSYNIRVGNRWISELNADDVLGDGTVKYDPSTKVLTLDNAQLKGYKSNEALYINDKQVTVRVIGNCSISGSGYSALKSKVTPSAPAMTIDSDASVFFVGDTVRFNVVDDTYPALFINKGTATFSDVTALFGENACIGGEDYALFKSTGKAPVTTKSSLLIVNSTLSFKTNASIYATKANLQFCEFEDQKLSFDNSAEIGDLQQVVDKKAEDAVAGNFVIQPLSSSSTKVDEVEGDITTLDWNKPVYDALGRRVFSKPNFPGTLFQEGRKYILTGEDE